MARLENGSYDEIVAHLEKEFELNALEESDDLPMATITSSSSKPKTPLSTGQRSKITCNYCKEKGHMVEDCEKLKKGKRKRCPTRQADPEENLSQMWDLWQDQPSGGTMLTECRRAS